MRTSPAPHNRVCGNTWQPAASKLQTLFHRHRLQDHHHPAGRPACEAAALVSRAHGLCAGLALGLPPAGPKLPRGGGDPVVWALKLEPWSRGQEPGLCGLGVSPEPVASLCLSLPSPRRGHSLRPNQTQAGWGRPGLPSSGSGLRLLLGPPLPGCPGSELRATPLPLPLQLQGWGIGVSCCGRSLGGRTPCSFPGHCRPLS